MRELNSAELSLVSGGEGGSAEVIVTAQRRNPNSIYMDDVNMTGLSLGDYLFGMQLDADSNGTLNPCERLKLRGLIKLACEAFVVAGGQHTVDQILKSFETLPTSPPPVGPMPLANGNIPFAFPGGAGQFSQD